VSAVGVVLAPRTSFQTGIATNIASVATAKASTTPLKNGRPQRSRRMCEVMRYIGSIFVSATKKGCGSSNLASGQACGNAASFGDAAVDPHESGGRLGPIMPDWRRTYKRPNLKNRQKSKSRGSRQTWGRCVDCAEASVAERLTYELAGEFLGLGTLAVVFARLVKFEGRSVRPTAFLDEPALAICEEIREFRGGACRVERF
jgi:hypothetical protein